MRKVNSFLNLHEIASIFIFWRLLIFLPVIAGTYLLPYKTNDWISYIQSQSNWANFDGIHYLNIAREGYINQARFFPLFPLILKIFPNINVIILAVSIIFFLSLLFLKKLIEIDFSKEIAKRSIFNLLIFPTSFFFVSVYSESLFLLLCILSFYFVRVEKWFLASISAMLLMTTRFVGIAILPALLYEFYIRKEINKKRGLYFLLMPLGLILYSMFNYLKWGNPFYYILAQGELGNNRSVSSIILFPQTIYRYIKIFVNIPYFTYEWGIAALELGSFIFASVFLYLAWKKGIRRSYLIFALMNFAIAISTGTFSGLPRYILVIFPIFISLAKVENKYWNVAYIILSPILLFILLMLFSRGYFVA